MGLWKVAKAEIERECVGVRRRGWRRTWVGEWPSREGCQKGHCRKKGKMMKSSVLDFPACAAAGGPAGSWPER